MAPSPLVKVEESIKVLEHDADALETQDEDEGSVRRYLYYKSSKVLGELFRAVDEDAILGALRSFMLRQTSHPHSLTESVWVFVQRQTAGFQWRHQLDFAREIKELYALWNHSYPG